MQPAVVTFGKDNYLAVKVETFREAAKQIERLRDAGFDPKFQTIEDLRKLTELPLIVSQEMPCIHSQRLHAAPEVII